MALDRAQAPAAADATPATLNAPAQTSAESPNLSGTVRLPESPVSFAADRTLAGSLSDLSMAYETQSLSFQTVPAANNNELLGAVLLLLLLEYMSTQDEDKKDALLGAIVGLASLQSQQADSISLNFSSTSLCLQSSKLQMISSDSIASTYNGAVADPLQVPLSDPSSGARVDTYA
jgi:hypothetical protein